MHAFGGSRRAALVKISSRFTNLPLLAAVRMIPTAVNSGYFGGGVFMTEYHHHFETELHVPGNRLPVGRAPAPVQQGGRLPHSAQYVLL